MNLSKNLLALLTVLLVVNQSLAYTGLCCTVMGGRSMWRKIAEFPAKCAVPNRAPDNDCSCSYLKDNGGMKHTGVEANATSEAQCRRRLIV